MNSVLNASEQAQVLAQVLEKDGDTSFAGFTVPISVRLGLGTYAYATACAARAGRAKADIYRELLDLGLTCVFEQLSESARAEIQHAAAEIVEQHVDGDGLEYLAHESDLVDPSVVTASKKGGK